MQWIIVWLNDDIRSMTSEEGIAAGMALSSAMGCEQEDINDRIACLRTLEPSSIYAQIYALDEPSDVIPVPPPAYVGYTGTIDANYMPEGEAFLPDNPVTLMETGKSNTIEITIFKTPLAIWYLPLPFQYRKLSQQCLHNCRHL